MLRRTDLVDADADDGKSEASEVIASDPGFLEELQEHGSRNCIEYQSAWIHDYIAEPLQVLEGAHR